MIRPASAKAKGSRLERRVASALGGKRTPLSGGAGGNDVTIPAGSIWNDWGIECKARGRLSWTVVWQALEQARVAKKMNQHPAAVVKEDRGPAMFVCYLDDLKQWAEALADTGSGYTARPFIRGIRQNLDALEKIVGD